MKSNNIKSISVVGDDKPFFIIEYNNNGVRKSFAFDDPQLQATKSYLQSQGKQSVSQSELQAEVNSSQSNKTIYWIFGGVVVALLALVGILIYFLLKKQKDKGN